MNWVERFVMHIDNNEINVWNIKNLQIDKKRVNNLYEKLGKRHQAVQGKGNKNSQ